MTNIIKKLDKIIETLDKIINTKGLSDNHLVELWEQQQEDKKQEQTEPQQACENRF